MSEPSHLVDILLPTFDNIQYLAPCLNSILCHTISRDVLRIKIINNGSKELENYITKHPFVDIIHTGKNLGWEGALKVGLEHSKTPFVCFMNDDTYVPYASSTWMLRLLSSFKSSHVAAAGPTSNVVRGYQNIFLDQFQGYYAPYSSLLIFFCVVLRRQDLDAVGGVDDTLPGGDDLDLSIRLRQAGKKLVICRDVFVYHHGFKTGERVRGGPDRPGGWNSLEMTERTNHALIRKHGFQTFLDCNNGGLENPNDIAHPCRDTEAQVVEEYVKSGVIYELGCGGGKTVVESIGFDRVLNGAPIPNLWKTSDMSEITSVADIVADVTEELPVQDRSADTIISRHILEHCVDTISTLKLWIKKLKEDGRLILTVPDERITFSIPINPEHKHAFTPESLKSIVELLGLKQVAMRDNYNGISFTSVFEHANHA